MTGDNVLVAANLTFNGWAASGVSATNGSLANALDGSLVTAVTANSNATWNAVCQFANLTAIDSFAVAIDGTLTWYFQTATGGTGVDGDFTTQWTGIGSTSEPIALPIAVSAKWVRLVLVVTGQPKNLYSLEAYQGGIAPPVDSDDLEAHFASWLNDTSGDHAHSSPILTQAAITNADYGLAAIKADVADVSASMLRAEDAVITSLQAAIDANATTLSTALGPGGAFLAGTLKSYLDNKHAEITNLLSFTKDSQAGPGAMAPATAPGWAGVDSGAFTGSFFVDARCDRVYVHITTIGEERPTNEVEGFEFLTAPWPWYVILANQVGSYQTSMAREAVLYVPGMRMDGVLVKLPPDCAGTWTAAMYTG